ncbi:hypothetical protein E2C01_038829 [Portunus trituberculatus]|uniref:Uncharacterized protein n=1 Tax=Portunus trituberculatus TaxID=210409 RepID=A0A5B7FJ28_PORTR|nr:hypothetical protein [Portunus trituberculatus]
MPEHSADPPLRQFTPIMHHSERREGECLLTLVTSYEAAASRLGALDQPPCPDLLRLHMGPNPLWFREKVEKKLW